ncbi:MAG: RIP metalloprotease RseP [Beijerinckiaceae bacterium]|nr:RIP metalloprotease RseP [Beijerinckiaceae bacterium]
MDILGTLYFIASYIIPFVAVLSIVVFFHEMGHFLVGRWCGVKVDAFSLGFGPEIFHFHDKHGTRWRLAALPLGGYVKFHGDANAASMSSAEQIASMPAEERAVSFFAQKVWKRAAIVAAGPIANFILAIVIFASIFYGYGREVLIPRIESVRAGEAGEQAGFQGGDVVVSIDNEPISNWNEMQRVVQRSGGVPLTFVVRRGSQEITLQATPRQRDIDTPFGKHRVGLLGVTASADAADWRTEHYSLGRSVSIAAYETWFIVERTASYVVGVFTGKETTDQISGPIRIAEISGEVAKVGVVALLNLAAILSVSVGLINLFPIPLLDGGHLLYYLVETLRGRPMSERAQELGFRVGIALVGALMLFATFNDVLHLSRG